MFTKWLSENTLDDKIINLPDYKPYPKAKDRNLWESLDEDYKQELIAEGEQYLKFDWPVINATDFMEFRRTGDREVHQIPYNIRRVALDMLVIAECVEHKGRFIDDIINGVWHICEESFWGVSAHNFEEENNLPNVENHYIDLFAGETATLMAHIIYLLGDELDEFSPVVRRRIEYEIEHRIKLPYLNRLDFWWMGYTPKRVNNWNPWVISNVLNVFLLTEKDNLRRNKAIKKSINCLQFFIEMYHDDGGCDEGPNYWDKAGGALFDCLDQLYTVSNGKINFFEEPLIKEMGRFLYRVYIDGCYYVNFADGDARVNITNHMVYRYGKRINDQKLIDLAIFSSKLPNSEKKQSHSVTLKRVIPQIMDYSNFRNLTATPPYERDAWLNGIEVAVARAQEGSKDGLFFVAKGGMNDESHNHNDVGTFTLYKNGCPAFIDIGVETYTRFTFSEKRYDIWTMQSAFHNLPTINGAKQLPGIDKKANNVNYSCSDEQVNFSVDITATYGCDAKINNYTRDYVYNRGTENSLEITDNFDFKDENNDLMLTFMTWKEPKLTQKGNFVVNLPDENSVYLSFDADMFTDVNVEQYAITDKRMQPTWEDFVYRITLKSNGVNSGSTKFIIK